MIVCFLSLIFLVLPILGIAEGERSKETGATVGCRPRPAPPFAQPDLTPENGSSRCWRKVVTDWRWLRLRSSTDRSRI